MSPAGTTARAALVALVTLGVDQAVKGIVRGSIAAGESVAVIPGVHLVHVSNPGVAFSMLSSGGWLPTVIGLAAVCALLFFFFTHLSRPLVWLPTGLLLGGAAGNLIDRLRIGSVTDFIKLPHWPAFNVADIAITVGVLVLVYVLEGPPRRARA